MSAVTDLIILALLAIGGWYILNNMKRPTPATAVVPTVGGGTTTTTTACDESLWNNVWQIPGKPRLEIRNRCTTITGIVGRTSEAPDGDFNFDLKPDSAFASMASKGAEAHNGMIWCELICNQTPRKSSKEPELDPYRLGPGGCKSYAGKRMKRLPKTGERVAVTGAYVRDIREGGHFELHPVSDIKWL